MARVGVKCRVIDLSWGDETVEYDLEVEAARAEYAAIPDDLVVSAEIDQDLDNQDTYAAVVEAVKDRLLVLCGLDVPSALIEVEGLGRKGPRGDSVKGDPGPPGGKGDKGYKWKTAWDKDQTYTVDDVVTFERATYICVKDVRPSLQFHDEDPDLNAKRTDPTYRYWNQISDRPPRWRKEWAAGKTYYGGDLVWVDTVAPNRKDKKTVYICVDRHVSAAGSPPSPETTNDPVSNPTGKWEVFSDEKPGDDGEGQTWKGVWSASAAYDVNDLVVHEEEMYVCVLAVAASPAGTNAEPDDVSNQDGRGASTTWWELVVRRTPKPFSPASWKTARNQLSGTTRKFRVGHLVKHANTQWICLQRHRISASPEPGKSASTWQNYLLTEEDGGIPTLRGEWSSLGGSTSFEAFDLVTHESATFKCRTAHVKSAQPAEPDDNPTYWETFSERPVSIRGAWNSGTKYKKGNVVTWSAVVPALGPTAKTYNFILNEKLSDGQYTTQPQSLAKWKAMDGGLGPTGSMGPTGAAGNLGKPGAGWLTVCNGKRDGSPIPVANRSSIIDGFWRHGFKSGDVPTQFTSVYMQLAVKQAAGQCTFQARLCLDGGGWSTAVPYCQVIGNARDNEPETGNDWDYSAWVAVPKTYLNSYPSVALYKVSGTSVGNDPKISRAMVRIFWE